MISVQKIELQSLEKAAIKIQKWIKGIQSRIRTHQLAKKIYYRRKIIQQLMTSQENYIRDLALIISDFKMKLLSHKIISTTQSIIIFSNIDQIRKLNQDFYAELYNKFELYGHYKCIFKDVHKQIFFFKIYFEYFNNFTTACSFIQEFRKTKIQFKQFLQSIYHNRTYRNLRLQDYLIKPVQRLPKYVILLKQLKKRTFLDHPDYNNICLLLQAFQKVNSSNNQKLNKVLNNYKLAEIQQKLDLIDIALPGVDFIGQQPITILNNSNKPIQAIIYLLSNQFIVKKARVNKLLCRVRINHGASILEDQDQLYYKNNLTVQNHQGDSFTILCGSLQEKQSLFGRLNYLICLAQKNHLEKAMLMFKNKKATDSFLKRLTLLDLMPQVTILGTAQRQARFLKYTVYIIEIKIKTIRQKIFLRFSELLAIQQMVKTEFPDIEIKQSMQTATWLLNHTPKIIEQRKMNIQRFLKEVLSKQEIIESGHLILFKLGLPIDFYDLPQKFEKIEDFQKSSLSMRSTKSKKSRHSKIYNRVSVFFDSDQDENAQQCQNSQNLNFNINQILKASQAHLGHFTRFSQGIQKENFKVPTVKLTVYLAWLQCNSGMRKIDLQMEGHQRVQYLISKVAKQLHLKYFKDFRLFLQRNYAQRVLDDDQIISKIDSQIYLGQYRILFKKMIYIHHDMQIKQLEQDIIRLRLISSQLIYDIHKSRYKLTYHQYLFAAIYVGIILIQKSQINIIDLSQRIKNMIIPKFSALENTQLWNQDFLNLFNKVYPKLKRISQQNLIQSKTMLYDTELLIDASCLAHFSIIQDLKVNPIYGAYTFMTQISHDFQKRIKQSKSISNQRNAWLAIKYDKVSILSVCLNIEYFSFYYDDLAKIETYPASAIIILKDGYQVKLKTTNSFLIRQLLLYYKNYLIVSSKMIKDQNFRESILQVYKDKINGQVLQE